METSGFQKIIDIISGALCILDFSYIISGVATYCIIMYSMFHFHHIGFDVMEQSWLLNLLLAYISGILSWIFGRYICKKIRYWNGTFEKVFEEWKCLVIGKLPLDVRSFTNKQLYTFFWIELDKHKPERASFINRFWVMQAMFEGLFASCLVAMVAIVELRIFLGHSFLGVYGLLLLFLFAGFACLLYIAAKEQEAYQIKEVILSYRSYCLEGSTNECCA